MRLDAAPSVLHIGATNDRPWTGDAGSQACVALCDDPRVQFTFQLGKSQWTKATANTAYLQFSRSYLWFFTTSFVPSRPRGASTKEKRESWQPRKWFLFYHHRTEYTATARPRQFLQVLSCLSLFFLRTCWGPFFSRLFYSASAFFLHSWLGSESPQQREKWRKRGLKNPHTRWLTQCCWR